MRILVITERYFPEIGGLQSVTHSLVVEFVADGHEVIIVTRSEDADKVFVAPYKIVRKPSIFEFYDLVKWCDVFYQACIGLKSLWPAIALRKPWFVTHHMIFNTGTLWQRALGVVKRRVVRRAHGIAVSNFIARHVGDGSVVIPNPYDDLVFSSLTCPNRKKDVVFVGRLIRAKGCHVLLRALAILNKEGCVIECTIIGDGPDRSYLEELAKELQLSAVSFTGYLTGEALAAELQKHAVISIPSIWPEPFGVVALEGIASGCYPIASDVGGLPEALGPCGCLVPPGSPRHLADGLRGAISEGVRESESRAHLSVHARRYIARRYINEFNKRVLLRGD